MKAKQIFVNLYDSNEITELHRNDIINESPAFEWIQTHNISDYSFVLLNHNSQMYYVSTSSFQFKL